MRFHVVGIRRQGRNSRPRYVIALERPRRPRARLRVEGLESRCLLSLTINEFPVPSAGEPVGITAGPDGNLWFTELDVNIGQINPTTHAITEFPLPTSAISDGAGITAGPDGNLWFTEADGNKIGMINPTTHAITEFPLPTAGSDPYGITAGPDGNLWFTESSITSHGGQIGMINPTTHAIAEFPLPTGQSYPSLITAGPDGNLWFTEVSGNKIGRITPAGAVTEFSIPTAGSVPAWITTGPDGNLWFTEQSADKIGMINPTTHQISEFTGLAPNSLPTGITAGPDGNLWFTEEFSHKIGLAVLTPAPDLAVSGTAPGSVTLGSNLTFNLRVTNDGTAVATGVTLTDALPSGVKFVSATGGVTPLNGVLTFTIGNMAAGATTTVALVITPTSAGSLTDGATVSMNQTDPTPGDNTVTLVTTVASPVGGDAPTVTLLQRFGFHAQPTIYVLTFSTALDPTPAQDVTNYRLTPIFGRRLCRAIPINAAIYDPITDTVTLHPADRV